ncbi:flocculation protein FLO11-like [Citrus sinensis]|uniref:flocculation protein FLO11-like n=1 Tax=Citrus sinensis TaxID=2711 RepID=UPI000763826A|nr:flocculation protein FLO11-like [Citrus sinensis]XP_024046061.1 flocculation protein FLO11-like [Citrus x clementina]
MPLEWLTNYEYFHQNSEPVQTTEATFERRQNGQVKLSFQTPETKPVLDTSQLSYIAMITVVQTGQEKKLPFMVSHQKDDTDVDDDLEVMRRKKKKKKKPSHPKTSCKSFPPQPPPDPKPPIHQIRSCLMFSSQSYEESFPPLEKQSDTEIRVILKPFVQSPVTASGQLEEPKQYEDVLNWQTKNATAQNQTLQQLGKKIDPVASQARPSLFTQTQTTPIPPPMFETYAPFYTPSKPQQPVCNKFFGFSHLQPTPQPKPSSPKKLKSKVKISEPKSKATSSSSVPPVPPEDSPKATPELPKKDKSPMDQYHYHTVQNTFSDSSEPETVYESNPSESNPSSSSSSTNSVETSTDSESEYADITSISMATKTEDPSTSTATPIV